MEVNLSFWEKDIFCRKVDLIVVGAGIVGLTAALEFKKNNPKASVKILDAERIPKGASTRNAGFACFGSMTELLEDIKLNGEDACCQLVEKRWKGLKTLRNLVGDKNMDYQAFGGNEIFLEKDRTSYQEVLDQIDRMNKLISTALNESNVFSRPTASWKNDSVPH